MASSLRQYPAFDARENRIRCASKGGSATVTIADVYQSNGVIHVVNKVLLPG